MTEWAKKQEAKEKRLEELEAAFKAMEGHEVRGCCAASAARMLERAAQQA